MIFTCTYYQGGILRNWVHKMLEMYNLVSSNVPNIYVLLKFPNTIVEVIVIGYICYNQIVQILQCYQICTQSLGILLSCLVQVEDIEIGYIVIARIIYLNIVKFYYETHRNWVLIKVCTRFLWISPQLEYIEIGYIHKTQKISKGFAVSM